ncbi:MULTISPECIES: hemolysin [Cupriavidus]|uniref:hemolysin n=1 Tax=Cupriavidus TaxID=106589 RepID=UPI0004AC58C3|nr:MULTISPECIES: hemolysin [Cupriavidus]
MVALMLSSVANAVVIDEDTFRRNGGDMRNVGASIRTANEKLQKHSTEKPWLAVGQLNGCTATWLGNKDGWAYILTAAHCVFSSATEMPVRLTATETPLQLTFKGWDGGIVASGLGVAYVPRERINIPANMGWASTDVALVKLPLLRPLKDKAGIPVERPILNDRDDEKGRAVMFVGYGDWGVGLNEGYGSESGARRLYGRSKITSFSENDHGIGASYKAFGPSANWARVAAEDGGSAWWQIRDTKPVIVATTHVGHSRASIGTRISKYANWIRSIYPEARFLSEIRPQGCIISLRNGAKYCLEVGQNSGYSLPAWIYAHEVYVQADSGVSVTLSDWDNLSYNRLAEFVGTVENDKLRAVKAHNGETLDFSKPRSMRVAHSTRPLGCIVSLVSVDKYCLPAGERSAYSLPAWIYAHDVVVQADFGTGVMLSDWDNLSYNRLAVFSGVVENENMTNVKAYDGQMLNFSKPRSMRVVQQ